MHEIFSQSWNFPHVESLKEIKCNSYGPRLYGWGTLTIDAEGHLQLVGKLMFARYQ